MSRGLGSMQRDILECLPPEGKEIKTAKLQDLVADKRYSEGKDCFIVLGGFGAILTASFCVSFYRALRGLEEKKLISWLRGKGWMKKGKGEVKGVCWRGIQPRPPFVW
jgi:hypothetical protein